MFEFEVRMHLCPGCGAPLQVPVNGGTVQCEFCQSPLMVSPRRVQLRHLSSQALTSDPSEAHRLNELWQRCRDYDTRTDRYSLENVPDGFDDIDGSDLSEATAQRLGREFVELSRPSGSFAVEEQHRLFWVTKRLGNLWEASQQALRCYAMLETASEVITDHGYRQHLYLDLASTAVHGQNFRGGEAWLAQCDLQTRELALDSSIREVRSKLHRQNEDWSLILDTIGHNHFEIPLVPNAVPSMRIRRAQALAALGLFAAAEAELMGAIESVALYTMDLNPAIPYGELGVECRRRAVLWVANLLERSADEQHLPRHSQYVWQRLQERGHLPNRDQAARQYKQENG